MPISLSAMPLYVEPTHKSRSSVTCSFAIGICHPPVAQPMSYLNNSNCRNEKELTHYNYRSGHMFLDPICRYWYLRLFGERISVRLPAI
jgi:hypothetical protein